MTTPNSRIKLDRMVDRVKPWLMVHGLVHGSKFMVWFMVWDTFLTLRGTWGFYLNHLIQLRPFKSVFDNVLLEHGGLPFVLPFSVHLDLEHLPDTVGASLWTKYSHSYLWKVSLIMFSLNMVDYLMFSLLLSIYFFTWRLRGRVVVGWPIRFLWQARPWQFLFVYWKNHKT